MVSTFTTQNKMIWIDLENPTREEVREIMNTYGIDPEVAEDLLDPTIHTRADAFDDFLYFVFHFPLHTNRHDSTKTLRSEEIDFVIGKNFLITIHYSPIESLVTFSKSFETDTILHHDKITKNSGLLFMHILFCLYKAVQEKSEEIHSTLNMYEEKIFSGKEKEMVFELSNLNRILIYFREALIPHKNIFSVLEKVGPNLLGKEVELYILKIKQEYFKSQRIVGSAKEYADELRETNNSLLTTKQNEVMKLLAIISFITFPLTLITSIFGMNTDYLPIVGMDYDFGIVISIMAVIAITFFMFFKNKKWM